MEVRRKILAKGVRGDIKALKYIKPVPEHFIIIIIGITIKDKGNGMLAYFTTPEPPYGNL